MPVVRDSDWVEREYGREKWPAIERIVDEGTTRESDFGRAAAGDISLEPQVVEAAGVIPANATSVVGWCCAP